MFYALETSRIERETKIYQFESKRDRDAWLGGNPYQHTRDRFAVPASDRRVRLAKNQIGTEWPRWVNA